MTTAKPSPSEHNIEQVLRVLRAFAPELLDRVRGASEAEIERIEERIGRTLLPGHKTFLRVFGNSQKGELIPFLYYCEFSVKEVLRHYDVMRRYETPIHPEWTFVTTMGATPVRYFLYHGSPDSHDPVIGRPIYDHDQKVWTGEASIANTSFYAELLGDAFVTLVVNRDDHSNRSGWMWEGRELSCEAWGARAAELTSAFEDLGFERWIFLAEKELLLRRGSAVLSVNRDTRSGYENTGSAMITGPDPREVREVYELLVDNFGLVETRRE